VRIAIFGGTFDPPHIGHLLAASDACDLLELDRVFFVPAASQPLKASHHASAEHRVAMVRALLGDDPRFAVDAIEVERSGLSFTVDTLAAYATRYPMAERFLLVGADVLATFAQWREPGRVRDLAEMVVLQRGQGDVGIDRLRGRTPSPRRVDTHPLQDARAVEAVRPPRMLETRRIDVSSTEIRTRVRDGKSLHGFVPEAVAQYIAATALYR